MLGSWAARALADGEALPISLERPGALALGGQDVPDLVVAHREVALPAGVARVLGGQALADGEALPISLERPGALALGGQDVSDPLVAHREVALPAGVARVLGGQGIQALDGVLQPRAGRFQVSEAGPGVALEQCEGSLVPEAEPPGRGHAAQGAEAVQVATSAVEPLREREQQVAGAVGLAHLAQVVSGLPGVVPIGRGGGAALQEISRAAVAFGHQRVKVGRESAGQARHARLHLEAPPHPAVRGRLGHLGEQGRVPQAANGRLRSVVAQGPEQVPVGRQAQHRGAHQQPSGGLVQHPLPQRLEQQVLGELLAERW